MGPSEYEATGREFWDRFWTFRAIEADSLPAYMFQYSPQARALLHDLELAYAARAYYACIMLAFSIVEIHLKHIDRVQAKNADQLLKKAGVSYEIDWLRKFRNDIVHGTPHPLVSYHLASEKRPELETACVRAFRFLHAMPKALELAATGTTPPGAA